MGHSSFTGTSFGEPFPWLPSTAAPALRALLPHLVPRLRARTPSLTPSECVRLRAPWEAWPASRQALLLSLENFIPAFTVPTGPRGLWGTAVMHGLLLPCLGSGRAPSTRGLPGGCRAEGWQSGGMHVPEVTLVASRCLAALGGEGNSKLYVGDDSRWAESLLPEAQRLASYSCRRALRRPSWGTPACHGSGGRAGNGWHGCRGP